MVQEGIISLWSITFISWLVIVFSDAAIPDAHLLRYLGDAVVLLTHWFPLRLNIVARDAVVFCCGLLVCGSGLIPVVLRRSAAATAARSNDEPLVIDHDHGGEEGDDENKVHQDTSRREDTKGGDGRDGGNDCSHERDDRCERRVEHGSKCMLVGYPHASFRYYDWILPLADQFDYFGIFEGVSPSVEKYKHIVCSDTKDEENDQDVQERKVVHEEQLAVYGDANRNRQDDLEHGHGRQEQRSHLTGHPEQNKDDRDDGKHQVPNDGLLEFDVHKVVGIPLHLHVALKNLFTVCAVKPSGLQSEEIKIVVTNTHVEIHIFAILLSLVVIWRCEALQWSAEWHPCACPSGESKFRCVFLHEELHFVAP
mmetsp:Transcript_246/g.417  ORF Transcript_246/g.417 Transcript_246/m.417 type:complete len:367 (+) Transcript_246:1186-2286(+)